jgi:hypothetical protein
MSPFREDHDARRMQVDELRRALATLRDELNAATRRAAEADALRAQVAALAVERDGLADASRRGPSPSRRWLAPALAIVGVVGGIALGRATGSPARERDLSGELRSCESARTELAGTIDALNDQMREAADRYTHELATAQPPLDTRAHRAHAYVGVVTSQSEGSSFDGRRCALVVSTIDGLGGCRLTLTCGDTIVFGRAVATSTCTPVEPPPSTSPLLAQLRGNAAMQSVHGTSTSPAATLDLDMDARSIHWRQTRPPAGTPLALAGGLGALGALGGGPLPTELHIAVDGDYPFTYQ